MPKHGHDYATAKILRSKGLTYSEIATQTGIPFVALSRYATRHEWDKSLDKVVALVSDSGRRDASQFAARLGAEHITSVIKQGNTRLQELFQYDFAAAVKQLDAEGYVRCLNMLDQIMRRTLRLDEQAASKPAIALQVNVSSDAGKASHADVQLADVQHLSDEQPATLSSDAAAS